MKVRVLHKDIARGQRKDGSACPLARALKRKVHADVSVLSDGVYVYRKGVSYKYAIADEARAFIKAFDEGRDVKGGWVEVTK